MKTKQNNSLKELREKIAHAQRLLMSDDGFADAMDILSEISGLRFGMQQEPGPEIPINQINWKDKP